MLFLSDEANPGDKRPAKRRAPPPHAEVNQASLARRDVVGAGLLVPDGARRKSLAVTPPAHTIDGTHAPDDLAFENASSGTYARHVARRMSASQTSSVGTSHSANARSAGRRRSGAMDAHDDARPPSRSASFARSVAASRNVSFNRPQVDEDGTPAIAVDFQAFPNDGSGDVESVDDDIMTPRAGADVDPKSRRSVIRHTVSFQRKPSETAASSLPDEEGGNGDGDGDDGDGGGRVYTAEEMPSSLFIFSGTNPIRQGCLYIIQHFLFHAFILMCIVLNSITLAMTQPAVTNPAGLDAFLSVMEYFFTVVFCLELVLRVIGLGFILHPHSYMRAPWNMLDFVIVVTSLVSLFLDGGNYSALRVVRVLRPLRSVSRIKNLRLLILGLFHALPEVANNLMLFVFVNLVFAIALVQLWSGRLSQRCYVTDFGDYAYSNPLYANLTTPYLQQNELRPCGGDLVCAPGFGNGSSIACEIHRDLYRKRNLNYDNFFGAALLVLKVMTFDNWPDDLGDGLNAVGGMVVVYFVLLTLIGGYVCVNLFLAVLTDGYSKAAEIMASEMDFTDRGTQTSFETITELSKPERIQIYKQIAAMKRAAFKRAKSMAAVSTQAGSSSPTHASQSNSTPTASQEGSSVRVATMPRGSSHVPIGSMSVRTMKPTSDDEEGLEAIGTRVEIVEQELEHISAADAAPASERARRRQMFSPEQSMTVGFDDDRTLLSSSAGDKDGDDSEEWDAMSTSDMMDSAASFRIRKSDPRAPARQLIGFIVNHRITEMAMIIFTALNVVVLAMDYYGIDEDLLFKLDAISLACTCVFALEIFSKLFAFGPRCLKNGFNALDLLLITISFIEIGVSGGGSSKFSAFRALRVFRVFRLLSKFESLQTVLDGIIQSVAGIGYLSMLVLLFLYVYAILGMQLFGTSYGANDSTVRDSFGTIWQSAITAFIVVTGDNWTDKMQVGMSGFNNGGEIIPVVYFVTLYMIGNYILINLSVAIIVDKLQEKMEALDERNLANQEEHPPILIIAPYAIGLMQYRDEQKAAAEIGNTMNSSQPFSGTFRRRDEQPTFAQIAAPRTTEERLRVEAALDRRLNNRPMSTGGGGHNSRRGTPSVPGGEQSIEMAEVGPATGVVDHGDPLTDQMAASEEGQMSEQDADQQPPRTPPGHLSRTTSGKSKLFSLLHARYADHLDEDRFSCTTQLRLLWKYFLSLFVSRPPYVTQNSLKYLTPEMPLRRYCLHLIGLPAYNGFILLCVVANVIFLVLDGPDTPDATSRAVDYSDYGFAVVFVLELIIKIIALGAFTPGEDDFKTEVIRSDQRPAVAYFRDSWNCIDCFVTIISIVGLFVPLLKALRAIRTIRLVARIETTRIILVALVQAVPHVLHGLLLSLVVFLVFGILGVQLFKGRMYRCNDLSISLKSECIDTYVQFTPGYVVPVQTVVPRVWTRSTYHFDHLGAALLTLFVVSVSDGWSEIMFDGMDTVDDQHAMKLNNAPWMSLYFLAVFIACNFFAVNMMIGILINYFSKKKEIQDGSALLTEKQRLYVKARQVIDTNMGDDEDLLLLDNKVSRFVHWIMAYKHPRVKRISIFDAIMLGFIIVNVIAVAAETDDMSAHMQSTLNTIQLVCLIFFTVEMVLKWVAAGPYYFTIYWNLFDFIIVALGWVSYGLPAVSFLAFLRVFRVVKLIRDTGVEKLLFRLIRSIRQLANVVIILLLTYFVFAVAGVALFGQIKPNGSITDNNNFRTVWNAMLVLYQTATTENWTGIMNSVSIQPPNCNPDKNECGNQAVATIFFMLYMVSCTFIVLQLFVAVIVEIFDDDDTDPLRTAFTEVRLLWIERFGENASTIHYTQLVEVLPSFPPILTDFDDEITRADMIRLLASLTIPIDSRHHVKYSDVVNALAFKKYQVDPRTMGKLIEDAMDALFIGTSFSAAQIYALEVIADIWKEYKGTTFGSAPRRRSTSATARSSDTNGSSGAKLTSVNSDISRRRISEVPTHEEEPTLLTATVPDSYDVHVAPTEEEMQTRSMEVSAGNSTAVRPSTAANAIAVDSIEAPLNSTRGGPLYSDHGSFAAVMPSSACASPVPSPKSSGERAQMEDL
jgi:voltage-dependent calcium channel T type alpha-1G